MRRLDVQQPRTLAILIRYYRTREKSHNFFPSPSRRRRHLKQFKINGFILNSVPPLVIMK